MLSVNEKQAWSFSGDVHSRNDFYNFNPSLYRGILTEAGTIIGLTLGFIFEGSDYDVIISGRIPVDIRMGK